ncbi:hypothetical protein PFISCL1PPCAC_10527 [Pristionchus fissidentatus]|uniref:Kinesin-like protein n=1 Tax=Pristionchus fissidentatus TaxID=1538716 RepID=A0AAV5VMQ8_9BILA|nr:hypothetical protein PFISCL1PPCAC_10527 [Pristionchus fissidentatus]
MAAPNPNECGVQVFCRIRPLNKMEEANQSQFIPKFQGDDTISLAGKVYVFDKVFKPNTTQEQLYMGAAYHIVQDVLSGYNGTVFAYGQTSSGKTHTMEGVFGDPQLQGIIPRIVQDVFNHIFSMDENLEFTLKVSYYEIYNEKIRDLLDVTKTNLSIHEDKNRVPYVKGATERFVSSPQEVMDAIEEGKNNRCVAVTNMNEHSSRSHSVFLIQVKQQHSITQKQLVGKLYLVDLAGSEKVSKTGAEGAVLEEAKNINKSLSALGNVISALAEGTKSHVPYRDSKLTRILQESLGGNSRTTVVICASPASYNEAETKSTLLFGQRAKSIKNVVVINEELTADEWKRRYEREKEKVNRLKAQLVAADLELQRWRKGEKVPESDWVSLAEGAALNLVPGSDNALTPSSTESMLMSMDRSIAAAQPPLLSGTGVITDEDRKKYEEERTKLYQQLDEKDDEIQQSSQMNNRLKQQMAEMEEQLAILQAEKETNQQENQCMVRENEQAKEETKEVLNALEELALNYDTKVAEAERLARENETFQEDATKKGAELEIAMSELSTVREQASAHKKRLHETMGNMMKELSETGAGNLALDSLDKQGDEEMFAHVRIAISKLSNDFKATRQKVVDLEHGSDGAEKKLETTEKELTECRVAIQQAEMKNKTLQDKIDETEKTKRELEQQVDSLMAKLSSAGGSNAGNDEEAEAQHKLVAALREEVAEKSKQLEALTASLQEMTVVKDSLTTEMEKLRSDEAGKEKRMKELSALSDKRDQARADLKGLEETMEKELNTLMTLKKALNADLAAKIGKRAPAPDADEEFFCVAAQKQKIQFLENNLDQLTKVHKQLVRDNADLRLELPKLEKRLKSSNDRVKNLESALREAKENAMKDRKKYQSEVERIKEAVRQRNLARKGLTPQIAKPIRPGQPFAPSVIRPPMQPGLYPTNSVPSEPETHL